MGGLPIHLPPGVRRALIVLSGDLPTPELLGALLPLHEATIAADGAAGTLRDLGITPDVVIGDLDSIGADRAGLVDAGVLVVEEPDQERNDFEKALMWALEGSMDAATIVGVFGGMPDHAVNNLSILARYARLMPLVVADRQCVAYPVVDRLALETQPGERVSLVPLPSATVTTQGLAWELAAEALVFGVREGASNRAVASHVRVEILDGVVLVFHWPASLRSGTV